MWNRVVLALVMMVVAGCVAERSSPEPVLDAPPALTAVHKHVGPHRHPCATDHPEQASSAVATSAPAPSASPVAAPATTAGPPEHVAGVGTLRVGVMHSVKEAERKRDELTKMLKSAGWKLEVWRTASGKDEKVRARVQVSSVDPGAGKLLCSWLATKGWKPGAVPCEMR